MFKPIGQTRVAQRVVEQIIASIREGHFQPGEKLPGENHLAAEFQVSRPCIREALRILETVGIVQSIRGKGCFVLRSSTDVDSAALWLSWLSTFQYEVLALLEVREAVECKIAALAAERAHDSDISEMEAVISEGRQLQATGSLDPDEAYALDIRFHHVLAQASRNPFLVRLSSGVGGAIEADRRATMSIPNRVLDSLEWHEEIFEAVRRRDPDASALAMGKHIRRTADDIAMATKSARPRNQ